MIASLTGVLSGNRASFSSGLGLGLSISRTIIGHHGGRMGGGEFIATGGAAFRFELLLA